ncbi:MAG: T9SS type A sorting domain-containing protein, partial [Candidatus Zixiibacteriota bacterium]
VEPDLVDRIDSVIQSLPASCFKGPTEQHKKALSNKLAAVKKSMAAGSLEGAISKLTNDIRAKTDGFVDGKPQDDWIIDEDAQVELCELIDELIDYLESGAHAGTESDPAASAENGGSEGQANLPAEFSLSQNRPNPFNPVTRIPFALPQASHVRLEIFNIMGQKVATLVDGPLEAGEHVYTFDGSTVASGVYLYRIQADNLVETRRMLLLK